jgi:hypothetical protein
MVPEGSKSEGGKVQGLVRNAPVNYAVRSGGAVTALTARHVWYGVGAPSVCQADPSSKVIKL